MKKLLPIIIVIIVGALQSALAGSTNVYVEDWGSIKGGSSENNANVSTVGWTYAAVSQTAGPYLGIYLAGGASDIGTGLALPTNTVYFTSLSGSQTTPGMFYTTDSSGSGSGGDTSFSDIDPTLYTNLTLSAEIRSGGGAPATNYFAVQVGGSWYVATNNPLPIYTGSYPTFTNGTLPYTNLASVWNNLTITGTGVTIGATAGANLSGSITGIGIVELPTTGGGNYNQLAVTAFATTVVPPTKPSINATAVTPQYTYVGGGASFSIFAAGTQPLTFIWESNGIPIPSGGRFLGTTNNVLTVTNANVADATATYSVIVTNIAGSVTNGSLALNVSAVPAGVVYAENFPYEGPTGSGNLPLTGVGWVSSAGPNTSIGIYSAGPGLGDCFSYSSTATTNIYYTTDTNDIGTSGLPFVDINPGSYPAITFQAGFVPGNAPGQAVGAISVYWAVAMNGVWYCSAQPQSIDLSALSPYKTYEYGFNPAATNWNNLTITGTGGTIGSQASGALTGNITGAGIVIAHNTGSGSDMNFQDFELTTNSAVGTEPSVASAADVPLAIAVASGGGASFGVSANGTQPFTFYWLTNNVLVQDGGRVSGATSATLTIANLTASDNNMPIDVIVSNSGGAYDVGANWGNGAGDDLELTVTNPPVGLIYSEGFPFVGPDATVNYPISSVGWVEAVVSAPNALFQTSSETSAGAIFAYYGSPATTVYYATTATDTNQAGLPFPNIDLAAYPSGLNFSAQIAPTSSASNVTAYVAVQLNGTNWYVSATPLPVANIPDSQTFSTYTFAFNPAAANWDNLTVTTSGGLIGSAATGNLKGTMTGAGLVFVTVGTGGTFNLQNFAITGTGVGGISFGATGGNLNLSWVGNPAVELQSTTNLTGTWLDVPNTFGAYSLTVPIAGPQMFFRLAP
ncbi:MAG TPA: hypothetical protein VGI03_03965 [Verrucomicrobiae bacterium]